MKYVIRCLLILSIYTTCTVVNAHHSSRATFKSDEIISVEGIITEYSFRNPHVLIYIDVTDANGTTINWMNEGLAANLLRRNGWLKDTLKTGDLIRVTGNSTHDGSPMVSFDQVEILNTTDKNVVSTFFSRVNRDGNSAPTPGSALPLTFSDNRPMLSGAWIQNMAARRGPPGADDIAIPYSEAGEAYQMKWEVRNDPQVFCEPPGLVRQAGFTPHPLRITQNKDHIIIEYEEYGGKRVVFLGNSLTEPGSKSHLGDAVAHYEGDTLVIESVNLFSNPSNPQGNRMSDQVTVKEVYSRADDPRYGSILKTEMTITDPLYLTEPWIITRTKLYSEGYEFIENDCRPPLRERK